MKLLEYEELQRLVAGEYTAAMDQTRLHELIDIISRNKNRKYSSAADEFPADAFVLVQELKKTVSPGGIYIPETADESEEIVRGKVISRGNDVADGWNIPFPGVVFYLKQDCFEIVDQDERFGPIHAGNILGWT